MHVTIFKKSEGELFVTPDDCETFQGLCFQRYPGLIKLHAEMVRLMNDQGYLDSFGGTRRAFFGRKDNGTVRDMLSHLPQAHTSFATNRFIERIYYWKCNRHLDNPRRLIIQPVNQVHDETCVVFPSDKLGFVKEFCQAATNIPMECWGQKFTIPFELQYGPNWGECKETL